MVKIISIDELIKELPDEVEVAISADPVGGRKLTVNKSRLPEIAKAVQPLRLWIPVPYKYSFAVKAPFMLLLANIDMFMYPDMPVPDADLVLIKINNEGVLLIDTDDSSKEVYRKIAEELQTNSAENIEILDTAYIPYSATK